jgi:predicted metal-dependent hydrolase
MRVTTRKNRSAQSRRDARTLVPASGITPEYTLRMSDRARRVRLTVTPRDGLVVVVPRAMRGFDPSAIIREHRAWIESAHARVTERRAALHAGPDALLPDRVAFPATGETWVVEYRSTEATTVRARIDGGLLVVQGAVEDGEACLAALQRWLQRAAAERLLPALAEESARTGLAYTRATVRGQRSRWGGCSSSGSITLNRCLLFLAPELMHAVMLHELAHLRHHNHSAAFWHELERLDPQAIAHRKAIAHAWDSVPPWAEP